MSDLKENIRRFVVSNFLFGEDDGLADNDSLLEKGIVDSTGVLELVAYLEQEFGIKVEDRELIPENLDSILSVTSYLERKLAVRL